MCNICLEIKSHLKGKKNIFNFQPVNIFSTRNMIHEFHVIYRKLENLGLILIFSMLRNPLKYLNFIPSIGFHLHFQRFQTILRNVIDISFWIKLYYIYLRGSCKCNERIEQKNLDLLLFTLNSWLYVSRLWAKEDEKKAIHE